MAYVAMGGTHVTGGVAGEDVLEGCAVQMSPSGLHADLPTVMLAASGSVNVFVALMPPDRFPRPTTKDMFKRNSVNTWNTNEGWVSDLEEFNIDTGQRGPFYLVGPSLLEAPIIYSGWMVQLHKGGAYTLTSGCFVDSTNIRRNGATVQVGASGKFQYGTSNVVGYVREYNARFNRLTIVLDQRSA
jgi:hypothetical protein